MPAEDLPRLHGELAAGVVVPPFDVVLARVRRHRRRRQATVGGTAGTVAAVAVGAAALALSGTPAGQAGPVPRLEQTVTPAGSTGRPPRVRGLRWDTVTSSPDGQTLVALGADCGNGQFICREIERVSRDGGVSWRTVPAPQGVSFYADSYGGLALVAGHVFANGLARPSLEIASVGGTWRDTGLRLLGGNADERSIVAGGIIVDQSYGLIDDKTKKVTCAPGVVVVTPRGSAPTRTQPRPPFQEQTTRAGRDGTLWQLSVLSPTGCGYPFPGQAQVHGKTAFTSSDGGRTWRTLPDPPDEMVTSTFTPIDGTTAFAERRFGPDPGLLVTRDGGRSWQDLHPTGLAGGTFGQGLTTFDGRHLAATNGGLALLVSTDGGASFHPALTAATGDAFVRVAAVSATRGLALTRRGQVSVTSDAGATWSPLTPLR